ncbi:PHB depolymerase family esterase [uncultured Marivita sp.]|uniref:extracellular catalytic domain type 1 short-chain-length polyhydroxyalkanoate depolymerase n=1 Tax=uncultured Marivita sp. TaxID=888080 RepID=UPI0026315A7C|nr:PHB depolymerase family esterase [uncultured Marivita sp.]
MKDNFATAMRRSLDLVRAGDPHGATEKIQEALRGRTAVPIPQHRVRQPLSKVLEHVPARRAKTQPDDTMQDRHFRCGSGSRDYRLFVPSPPLDDLRGLVIMLHGCTQNPDDFATGTSMNRHAERHGFVVAYPSQPRSCNMNGCWNWFEPAHQDAQTGEPAILSGLTRSLQVEFSLLPRETFVAGLSAGGAMAAILAEQRPDVFAGAGVHSGLPTGSAHDVTSAFAAMRGQGAPGRAMERPAIVFQGLADPTVAAVNASRLVGVLRAPERQRIEINQLPCQVTKGWTGDGHPMELWLIEGAAHAWLGGNDSGSHTDAKGPDASAEMLRFFNSVMEKKQ